MIYDNNNEIIQILGIVCRGISWGGALSVAKLIEERAPPVLRMTTEIGKLIQPVYSVS